MKRLLFAVAVFSLVSGCALKMPSFSFLKFWGDDEQAVAEAVVVDPTRLMTDLIDARIEPVQEGVILRATGIAPTQGYHSARLVLVSTSGAVITFQLRALAPEEAARQGTARSRQLLVARLLTFSELQGVRTIEVITANRKIVLRNR